MRSRRENQHFPIWFNFKNIFIIKDFIYLFLEKGKGREKKRDNIMYKRNIDWLPLTCPNWEPGLQPRHVP